MNTSAHPAADTPTSTPARLGLRFLFAHPAHFIALGAGAGLSPIAPGTAGTLAAWASFALMQRYLSPLQLGGVIAAGLLLGWWACTVTANHLRTADPGAVVWDEVLAFWIILWLITPAGLAAQLLVFVLFRILDAIKPGPVAWADRLFHGFGYRGGFGILFDDLVAAGCTLWMFALWRFCLG